MNIHKKLLVGLAPGLLLILMLGLLAFGALRVVAASAGQAEQAWAAQALVYELQIGLQQAAIPPNDYLITGNPQATQTYDALSANVHQNFTDLFRHFETHALPIAAFEPARSQWQAVDELARAILELPDPARSEAGVALMEQMDAQATQLTANLAALTGFAELLWCGGLVFLSRLRHRASPTHPLPGAGAGTE